MAGKDLLLESKEADKHVKQLSTTFANEYVPVLSPTNIILSLCLVIMTETGRVSSLYLVK